MLDTIIFSMIEFFKGFGYFGVLLALCFEFIPAEIILPLAGFWISQGGFNYWLMVLAGTVGGTIGPLTLYAVGRYGGRPLVLKYGKFFLVNEKQVNAADKFFAKYGAGVAFFGRFMPIVRTAISVPCGMTKMNVWKFSVYTFFAMLPITALYVYLGIKLGENWEQAGELFTQYLKPFVISIAVLVIIYAIYKYRIKLLERKMNLNKKK
ncbi:DedA family protein [Solibacillus silvestris]|uniref:DedA family protein n=1 Tax=Solibacillus silvestris TaxID=76853 RepID=UPI003F7D88CB